MTNHQTQQGNVIFFILIAVVLFAALNYALMRGDGGVHNIDKERHLIIVTEVEQYGSELTQAVKIVLENGLSEADISFAHVNAPSTYGDATDLSSAPLITQIFSPSGGAAEYRTPNPSVSSASNWEFYGESHMPQVGSSRADLIAVLPDVTTEFCIAFNIQQGLSVSGPGPEDNGTCFHSGVTSDRFDGSFNSTPNTLDFGTAPTPRACVTCDSGDHHIYIVLYER